MNSKTVLILGGYGNTGLPLARLLHQHTRLDIIIAGRNVERANAVSEELNNIDQWQRVTSQYVDASDPASVRAALEGNKQIHLIIVASSTAKWVKVVAQAALDAKVDYYDCQFTKAKTEYLQSIEADIKNAGCFFVTDGGFHPGLPAAMIRHVAPSFSRLESAHVGSVIQLDWAGIERMSSETMEEFAGEFSDFRILVYERGEWKDVGLKSMMNPLEMDFGDPFGRKQCFPMFLEEMREIPKQYPTVTDTGFYVGSMNWVVDWFIFPFIMVTLKIFPQRPVKRAMGRFLYWGLRNFSKPPYGTVLKLEARGIDSATDKSIEKTLTLSHKDGYALTAIPVAATVLQYLDEKKSIRKPGLWLQANIVDPKQLMVDMNRMGVEIKPPLDE